MQVIISTTTGARLPGKGGRSALPTRCKPKLLDPLLFLYRHILGREIGGLGEVIRGRRPRRLPAVMTRDEVNAVRGRMTGDKWLMASLLDAAGLRWMECLRLRVQDFDFARNEITVRDGNAPRTVLPCFPRRSSSLFSSLSGAVFEL